MAIQELMAGDVGAEMVLELYELAWKTIMVIQYGPGFDFDATLDDVMEIQEAMSSQDLAELCSVLQNVKNKYNLTLAQYEGVF